MKADDVLGRLDGIIGQRTGLTLLLGRYAYERVVEQLVASSRWTYDDEGRDVRCFEYRGCSIVLHNYIEHWSIQRL